MKVEDDREYSRFLVRLPEGELVYKRIPPRTLELVHTDVAPALRGRGVAEALVEGAMAHAREEALSVVATCPYVQRWLAKHPEHRDLMVPGSKPR